VVYELDIGLAKPYCVRTIKTTHQHLQNVKSYLHFTTGLYKLFYNRLYEVYIIVPSCIADWLNAQITQPTVQPVVYNRFYRSVACPITCCLSSVSRTTGCTNRLFVRLHYATLVPGCRLDVGGCKNSTCLILATEQPTANQTVNMSVNIKQPMVPTRFANMVVQRVV
jgi:hypothetical protein